MPVSRLPRPLLVSLALVLAVGCYRPARFRFTPKFGSMRAKLVAAIRPPGFRVANVDVSAAPEPPPGADDAGPPPGADDAGPGPGMPTWTSLGLPPPPPPPQAQPPASRPRPAPAPRTRPAPTPRPEPGAPRPRVDRVDASRSTVFVLRGQSHGGEAFCETHDTLEACNAACTAMLRQSSFSAPTPSSPKGCACTEADRGC